MPELEHLQLGPEFWASSPEDSILPAAVREIQDFQVCPSQSCLHSSSYTSVHPRHMQGCTSHPTCNPCLELASSPTCWLLGLGHPYVPAHVVTSSQSQGLSSFRKLPYVHTGYDAHCEPIARMITRFIELLYDSLLQGMGGSAFAINL